MKNSWLRAEEHGTISASKAGAAHAGFRRMPLELCERLPRESGPLRPKTAPSSPLSGGQDHCVGQSVDPARVNSKTRASNKTRASSKTRASTPETRAASPFRVRRDYITETIRSPYKTTERMPFWPNSEIRTDRKLDRAKRLLEGVIKRGSTQHDGVAKPADHITRKVESVSQPQLKRSSTIARYNFSDSNFLTFRTHEEYFRPVWDKGLRVMTAEEKTVSERRARLQAMKDKSEELNAITGTVKEVLVAYSGQKMCYLKDNMTFSVPIYLNNHEIHAWRTLKNLLYSYGESFTLSHIEELGAVCGLSRDSDTGAHNSKNSDSGENVPINLKKFRWEHPEIFHFVCYCNLLLGGTKSFASAKFMLLRNFGMLLTFIQQVNPLLVPIANLRAATAFRLREARLMQHHRQTTEVFSSSINSLEPPPPGASSLQTNSMLSSKVSKRSKKSLQKKKYATAAYTNPALDFPPWDKNTAANIDTAATTIAAPSVASVHSKLTMFTGADQASESAHTVKAANTSVFTSLPRKLSSWTLAFSLLARIILVSAARTPGDSNTASDLSTSKESKGKASGEVELMSEETVQTEEVRLNQDAITTLITDKQPNFTRLPPTTALAPDHSPTGLFNNTSYNATSSSNTASAPPPRRRETLNRHLQHQEMQRRQSIKELQLKDKAKAARASRSSRQSVVVTKDGGGTAGMGRTQAEAASKLLSSVRTMSISQNFRNAQKMLLEIQKESKSGSEHATDDDFSDEDEFSDVDDDVDIFHVDSEEEGGEQRRGGEQGGEDDSNMSFMQLMRQQSGQHASFSETTMVNPCTGERSLLRQQTSGPATSNQYYLYADMMNEAESIELLSQGTGSSSDAVRTGVLGSLSSKQDERREQRKWKETKEDEQKLFEKNLETNKECIDAVVRMFRLKAEVSPSNNSKSYQEMSNNMWSKHLEHNKQRGLRGGGGRGGAKVKLDAEEVKMLSLLRLQETKEDSWSSYRMLS